MMKHVVNILTLALVVVLVACQKDVNEYNTTTEEVTITFVAEPEATRTTVDTSGDTPRFSWDEDEKFVVLEQTDKLAEATSVVYANVDGKANITATFNLNKGKDVYRYATIYPESGFVEAEDISSVKLRLPVNQTMAAESYDPMADLMVSKVVEKDAQPTTAQLLQFTRLAAVVKMSIVGLNIAADEEVMSVTFSAEGKDIAGTISADLAEPHNFTVVDGESSVSITTASQNEVYFTLLPTTLVAGDKYTVTVTTTENSYVKSGVVPEDRSLIFAAGMVTRFGVDMSSAVKSEKWEIVKDSSTLADGDEVIIVALNADKAMGHPHNTTNVNYNAHYNVVNIVKSGDAIYDIADSGALILTLTKGSSDGTFAFKFNIDSEDYYLSTTTSQNGLRIATSIKGNTSFTVSIDSADGGATIQSYKVVKFDSTIFTAYPVSDESTVENAVAIYRKVVN